MRLAINVHPELKFDGRMDRFHQRNPLFGIGTDGEFEIIMLLWVAQLHRYGDCKGCCSLVILVLFVIILYLYFLVYSSYGILISLGFIQFSYSRLLQVFSLYIYSAPLSSIINILKYIQSLQGQRVIFVYKLRMQAVIRRTLKKILY